jgi:TldD protein
LDELATRALDTARTKGASYADIRLLETETQSVVVKNGIVEAISTSASQGFGVRVIVDGAWGFASSARLDREQVDEVTALAVDIARSSALVKGEAIDLGAPEANVGTYHTPVEVDPFRVPLEQKIDLLLQCDKAMRRARGVAVAEGNMLFLRSNQAFASTEGSLIEQEIVETGAGLVATAVGENEVQKRSYPNSFGRHQGTGGYEFIERYDLPGNAQRLGEEAVALLSARQCPSGVTTLILGPTQLALQVHESCGHPTELDRALGTEASYAGTSFLTPDKLGTFRYGSEIVNITADATLPGGLGTFGYDDEGVPAQRTYLVKGGLFVGYLTSRETASRLGQRSNGTMRADGWGHIPLIRMTNINLEPGVWELEDLIADTDDGIYMEMNKSWSIDDKRLNFQFGTEIAYGIKNGQRGDLLKNATYAGMTPRFWGSCDAICNEKYWDVWGTPNCGKGQPGQVARVGHGTSMARFRDVQVGVMR